MGNISKLSDHMQCESCLALFQYLEKYSPHGPVRKKPQDVEEWTISGSTQEETQLKKVTFLPQEEEKARLRERTCGYQGERVGGRDS